MISIIIQFVLMIVNILLGENLRKAQRDYRLQYFVAGLAFMGAIAASSKLL
jgi:hypothetical protein